MLRKLHTNPSNFFRFYDVITLVLYCKWKIVSVRKSCKEMLLLVTLYSQPRLRSVLCLQVRISHDFVKLSPGYFMVSHMHSPLVSHNALQDSASCKTCETCSGAICDLE